MISPMNKMNTTTDKKQQLYGAKDSPFRNHGTKKPSSWKIQKNLLLVIIST